MGETEEEGIDFVSAFVGQFASHQATEQRLKAERRAGLTPKQGARRKGPPKQQINFRATAETKALIEALGEHLGKNVTDVSRWLWRSWPNQKELRNDRARLSNFCRRANSGRDRAC
jgi:hypothetical protein